MNYWLFEKVYQTLHSVFHLISRHLEVGLKKLGCASLFNPLLGILISDETLRVVFDILHHGLTQTFLFLPPTFYALWGQLGQVVIASSWSYRDTRLELPSKHLLLDLFSMSSQVKIVVHFCKQPPAYCFLPFCVINIGKWFEWRAIWSEIIRVTLKLDERTARVRFEITRVWFQTKIARHETQLPLYYSHFEIAEFSQYQYLFDQIAGLFKAEQKGFYISLCTRSRNGAM